MKPRPPSHGRTRRECVAPSNARTHKPRRAPAQVPISPDLAALRAQNAARDERQRLLAQIISYGKRPVTEMIVKLADDHPAFAADLDRQLPRYAERLEAIGPDLLAALGGDCLPPRPPPRLVQPTTGGPHGGPVTLAPVAGLLGGSISRDASAPAGALAGFALGHPPAPPPVTPMPPGVTITLLRAGPDLGRQAWDFLRGHR